MHSKTKSFFRDILITLAILTVATILGVVFQLFHLHESNAVIMYIFSAFLIARLTKGYFYAIFGTVCSLLLFNWFFTEPIFTFKVDDPIYIITFLIMSVTAIMTSALTTKVKEGAILAREKEAQSNALYKMTSLFTDAENIDDIATVTMKTVSKVLSCNAGIICISDDKESQHTFIQNKGDSVVRRELLNFDEIKGSLTNMQPMFFYEDKEFSNCPIYGGEELLAILRIPKEVASVMSEPQLRLVHSIVDSTSLAMEKLKSLKEQASAREEATQEHYRGNLLRAISHDIRTPLSGIMGNGEMIMGMAQKDSPIYSIAEGIYKDADWLHSLVENILNLTKLQDGKLILQKSPEAVEEIIGASITVMEKRFPDREINVEMPSSLIMVPMDAKLISQVLVNLLDNAVKHSEQNTEIKIVVKVDDEGGNVMFSVLDRGEGISENDLPSIFKMFYTTRGKGVDSKRGVGLGLAICQSIVEAHGGKIFAQNRIDGGSEFTFTLPQEVADE